MSAQEIKIVCFNLADEEYGLDVSCVLGVNPLIEIIRVPRAPDFVDGIIRIRGKVIPVIDIKKRFGIEIKERSKKSRIIIINAGGLKAGIVVDGVSGIVSLPEGNIELPSALLSRASFLKGVGKIEERSLLLLDPDKLLSQEEVTGLGQIQQET